jgi:hypothetical protein
MDFPTAIEANKLTTQSNNYIFDMIVEDIKPYILSSNKFYVKYTLDTNEKYNNSSKLITFLINKGYKVKLIESDCQWDSFISYLEIKWY